MNIHTPANSGGEIRGQVRTLASTSVGVLRGLTASGLSVSASPNPTMDVVTINVAVPQTSKVGMRVYDALGKAVSEPIEGIWTNGTANAQFNVSNYPAGVYYCRISLSSGETAVQGFVVTR